MEVKHNPWAVKCIDTFLFYNCPECDVKEKDPESFRNHALENHEKAKEALDSGDFDISDPDTLVHDINVKEEEDDQFVEAFDEDLEPPEKKICLLKPHIELHRIDKQNPWQCYFCGKIVFKKENMKNHIIDTHSKLVIGDMYGSKREYQCCDCLRMFENPKDINVHICGILPSNWLQSTIQKCPECSKDFESNQLFDHYISDHKVQDKFTCPKSTKGICGSKRKHIKDFVGSTRAELSDHIRKWHTYDCKLCYQTFSKSKALQNHKSTCVASIEDTCHCFFCGEAFQTDTELEKHLQTHSSKSERQKFELRCCWCDFVTTTSWLLEQHKKQVHSKYCEICDKDSSNPCSHLLMRKYEKKFMCELCDYRCSTIQSLQVHKERLHEKVRSVFCDQCGKGFYREFELKHHIKVHHSTKPTEYKCDKCDKVYSNPYILNSHIQMRHGSISICTKCDKIVDGYRKFRLHLRNDHSCVNIKKDVKLCPQCDQRFVKTNDLNEHLVEQHSFTKSIPCSRCSDVFVTETLLTSHLIEIHDYNPMTDRDRTSLQGLKIDANNGNLSKPFHCEICNLYFSSSATLSNHHKQKHMKESHSHFCEDCDFSSFEAARVRKHWLERHGEKKFKCDQCDFSATVKSRLNYHIKTKHELHYSCTECEAKFKEQYLLAKHCLNDHQILMTLKKVK